MKPFGGREEEEEERYLVTRRSKKEFGFPTILITGLLLTTIATFVRASANDSNWWPFELAMRTQDIDHRNVTGQL